MALLYSSDKITDGNRPSASPHSAGEVYVVKDKVDVAAVQLADGNMIGCCILPPNCVPIDCIMLFGDLEGTGTPALLLDVGILNAAKTGLVPYSLFLDGIATGQAGGMIRMAESLAVFNPETWLAEATCPGIHEEKIVAVEVMATAVTVAAAAREIEIILTYRAVEFGG